MGQANPLMRETALLCPEIHGETGLDGPHGGPVLPHSKRQPLPGDWWQATTCVWLNPDSAAQPAAELLVHTMNCGNVVNYRLRKAALWAELQFFPPI